ncbi:hypothetical protein AB205_0118660, partial [Aquarana catesbeiana]
WSGRNHREKIGVHVFFDQVLNMEPYCRGALSPSDPGTYLYDLSAVVMHHGFWVHCNDSKLNMCSVEEVCRTQAYILFYTQRSKPQSGVQNSNKPSDAGIADLFFPPQAPTSTEESNMQIIIP